jgi:hypothetical protein
MGDPDSITTNMAASLAPDDRAAVRAAVAAMPVDVRGPGSSIGPSRQNGGGSSARPMTEGKRFINTL